MQLHRLGGRAAEGLHRRGPAHELLDGHGQPLVEVLDAATARWSGNSVSACIACEVVCRVVSLAATASSTKKAAISWWVSRSPSISASTSAVIRSSCGRRLALGRQPGGVLVQRGQALAQQRERLVAGHELRVRGVDEQVGGLHHPLAVGLGHAEHLRPGDQRQPLGDERDEVAAAGGRRPRPPPGGRWPRCPPRCGPPGAARTPSGPARAAWCGAARPWPGRTARPRASPAGASANWTPCAGAEALRVARDRAHVVVAHDRPEALLLAVEPQQVLGLGVVRDRRLAAQHGERLVPLGRRQGPEVERAEVDYSESPFSSKRLREASISSQASSREYQPSTLTFFCSRSL